MTDEDAPREKMSSTHRPSSSGRIPTACQDCEAHVVLLQWRKRTDKRLDEGDETMSALAIAIDKTRESVERSNESNARYSLEIIRQIGDLNQRVGGMLQVAASVKTGRDIDSKTPGRPELKLGPASLKAPPGTLVTVILVALLIAAPTIAAVYLTGRYIVPRLLGVPAP